jgi:hypothetical protein
MLRDRRADAGAHAILRQRILKSHGPAFSDGMAIACSCNEKSSKTANVPASLRCLKNAPGEQYCTPKRPVTQQHPFDYSIYALAYSD